MCRLQIRSGGEFWDAEEGSFLDQIDFLVGQVVVQFCIGGPGQQGAIPDMQVGIQIGAHAAGEFAFGQTVVGIGGHVQLQGIEVHFGVESNMAFDSSMCGKIGFQHDLAGRHFIGSQFHAGLQGNLQVGFRLAVAADVELVNGLHLLDFAIRALVVFQPVFDLVVADGEAFRCVERPGHIARDVHFQAIDAADHDRHAACDIDFEESSRRDEIDRLVHRTRRAGGHPQRLFDFWMGLHFNARVIQRAAC